VQNGQSGVEDWESRMASVAQGPFEHIDTKRWVTSVGGRSTLPAGSRLLSGHDVGLAWILAVMTTFGALVGLTFPAAIASFVVVRPGQESAFLLACVLAGLSVGGFAYGVAVFTLHRANRHLSALAAYDPLTGLANRRQFVRSLDAELAQAIRSGEPTSLVVADIDRFKDVNDTHGHLVGDDVLVAVASVMTASVRPSDLACRIGGEEFALVLPATDRRPAVQVAARVRAAIENADCAGLPRVTVSCGVATYPGDADSASLLTKRADDAMYAAKRAGRNAVVAWGDAGAGKPEVRGG